MTYDDLYVLIPSHSLEDFPTDLGEEHAAALLNAFAVLWHPLLLAEAETIPSWHRSDEPPETLENRLVIIPSCAEEWLPGGWAGFAEKQGAVVVSGTGDREEMIHRAVAPLPCATAVPTDLTADFLALGTCHLLLELLTIHMHHFSNLDEVELQRDAVAAAKAAVSGDEIAARTHLRSCFETLLEARERFYPVDCYLVDLCLLIPRLADQHFQNALSSPTPLSVLVCGCDLQKIAAEQGHLLELMREAWDGGRLDILGGELHERPSPLLPLESLLWEFRRGLAVYEHTLGRTPRTWGRRRFGFTPQIQQILNKSGYLAALHIALDDGVYPDAEQSKIRWEGCDGTVIDAITRIPLAADSATSYLRFPQRLGESMEEDHVATVILARWPEVKAPWLDDLRRIHHYAPVLGRFVTLEDFFEHTDDPGRLSTYEAGDYLSPFLIQAVAREETDPISRYGRHLKRRQQFNVAAFFDAVTRLLQEQPVDACRWSALEETLESSGPDLALDEQDPEDPSKPNDQETGTIRSGEEAGATDFLADRLCEFHAQAAQGLCDAILCGAGTQPGYLLLNPLSFSRRVVVELPELASPPNVNDFIQGTQFDDARRLVSVELPPCGFLWVGDTGGTAHADSQSGPPLAEEDLLRNEFFEVWLNGDTGGIGRIKGYGRSPNRLSQQLAFRFPQERSWTEGSGDDAERFKSYYSQMRRRSTLVKSAGPLLGEIETSGEILDQTGGSTLAQYRQTYRIYRSLPYLDLEIELQDVRILPEGDPWTNYYACRWAYNDMTASVTRSVQQGAHGFKGQRFESLHYLEIATAEQRTAIALEGLAFHRKTGPRMIDTLLIVPGETQRRFRFRIAFDVDYPLQPALELLTPPTTIRRRQGPPLSGSAGWLFHLNAKNVQLLSIFDLPREESDDSLPEEPGVPPPHHPPGVVVRLLETEGRSRRVRLRCFRTPQSARQCDLTGKTVHDLSIDGESVLVEMTAHEIADVHLQW